MRKRIGCSLSCLIVVLSSSVCEAQPRNISGVADGSVAWGDFDNDGDLDLLITGTARQQGSARIYRNDTGAFKDFLELSAGAIHGPSFVGDFDRDGFLDVLVTFGTEADSLAHILLNRRGSFVDLGIALPGVALGWEDCNGDGLLDIVTGSGGEAVTRIHFQSSAGRFDRAPQVLNEPAHLAAWADFDSDGLPDLLLNFKGGFTRLYRLVNGERYEHTQLSFPVGETMWDWGDIDNDGDPDLLLAARTSQGNLVPRILQNEAGARFTDLHPEWPLLGGSPALFGDYDGDGRLDAFLFGVGLNMPNEPLYPRSRVFRNIGNSVLVELPITWPPIERGAAAAGDYDANGTLDFVMTGTPFSSSDPPAVWITSGPPSPGTRLPSPPTGLANVTLGDRAILTWAPSSHPVQTGGLTYNLRLGTRAGAADIVAPLAAQDGRRLVAQPGNCFTATRWRLRDLPPGRYFWSVQAIDHQLRASGFAPEKEFVIGDPAPIAPPALSKITEQIIGEDGRLGAVPVTVGDPQAHLWVTTSNPGLVFPERVTIEGTGTIRFVSLTPADGVAGEVTIFLNAESDFGAYTNTSFHLTILPIDDPPSIRGIRNLSTFSNEGPSTLTIKVGDDRAAESDIVVSASAADSTLVDVSVRPGDFSGSVRNVIIEPVSGRIGSTSISVLASDGVNVTETNFVVTVRSPLLETSNLLPDLTGYSRGLAWGDYDGDGQMDLFVATEPLAQGSQPYARLLRNEKGRFIEAGLAITNFIPAIATWGDTDNDGDLDLYTSGATPGGGPPIARLMRNDGLDGFTALSLPYPLGSGSAKWIDVDNDGDLDLLVAGATFQGTFLRILRNDGDNHFAGLSLLRSRGEPLSLEAGDFDLDGDKDLLLVLVNNLVVEVKLLRNDGVAGFVDTSTSTPPPPGTDLFSVGGIGLAGWCDFDNDGFLDVWTAGTFFLPSDPRLFRNDHHGGFENPILLTNTGTPILWADLDNDGDQDLISNPASWAMWSTGQPANRVEILRNDGLARFTSLGHVITGGQALGAVPADIDRNGTLDLVLSQWISPPVLLRNNSDAINSLPNAPGGLQATTNGTAITFSWQPAIDENQAGSLTYNLRVGTSPGANDALSAMSLPNGTRLIAEAGNVGSNLRWTLTNLTAEAYFWSVQAVDQSFAGSAFAPEQIVVLNPSLVPPSFSNVPPQTTLEDKVLEVSFTVADERTPPGLLRVRATSSNPLLIPNANLRLAASNQVRTLSILPATNQSGSGAINLTVTDASGLFTTTSFDVHVSPVNDRPFAPSFSLSTDEDHSRPIVLQGSDVEGDQLTYQLVRPPLFGVVRFDGSDTVVYSPSTNFFGIDQFTYRASDGPTNSNTAVITLYVTPVIDRGTAGFTAALLPDGAIQFTFAAEPWQRFRFESSDDLFHWRFETIVQSPDGIFQFVEEDFQNRTKRFYRMVPTN